MRRKQKNSSGQNPTKKEIEREARIVLTELLTFVLKSKILRARAGIKLPKNNNAHIHLSLDLEFLTAVQMKRLNKKHRGLDKVTDVLSFPAHPVFQKQGHLGDVVICLPVLKAQAKSEKLSPFKELRILLTHGVLHLLHFDHERGVKDARVMAAWEKKLLKSRGLIARTRDSA